MKGKWIAVLRSVLIGLTVLAGAIALPVLWRSFFYLHIEPLNLTDAVGLTAEQVKTAYNEMMDFCIGLTDNFSVGVLDWSEAGKAHFADVRKLFVLDLWVLAVSAVLLLALTWLRRKKRDRLCGHTPGFWGAVGLGAAFLIVGGLAALDFNRAFVIFHQLFFPGKDNWLFDGREDPVIYMLPQEFFRNCAILILSGILLVCCGLIGWDLWKQTKDRRKP